MINYDRPWHVLDIDVSNAVKLNFNRFLSQSEYANKPGALWNFKDDNLTDLFNQQWLNYFSSLGFNIRNVLLFYQSSGYMHPVAHIDYVGMQNPTPAIYALNFVASPNDDSKMVWYNQPDRPGVRGTDANFENPQNHYEFWPIESLVGKEIAHRRIGNQLTLVSTGQIHNIIVGKQPRWAVSIRLTPNYQIQTWRDAVTCFSPFIKESIIK